MKKLVFLFALAAVTVMASAQSFTVSERSPFFKYTGTAADTAISGSTKAISWQVNYGPRYMYHVVPVVEEISGAATASVILQGSMDNSNWVAIDTLTATDDASLNFDDKTNGYDWPYMRVLMSLSTTGKWDFDFVRVKVTPWKQ